MTAPMVSCIMPTRDRRRFVTQALRCFAQQDYPELELIVVDDGHDAVGDLMPVDDLRVRYLRLDGVTPLGIKRNVACAQARGEFIAHWDDDDWSAPQRVRRQVETMLAADAKLCGLTQALHYRPLRGDAWRGHADAPIPSQISGASLVYRRPLWREHGFDHVTRGEDNAFLDRVPGTALVGLADPGLMIVIDHGGNMSARALGGPRWRPAPLDEVGELLGDDRGFYSVLRGGSAVAAPPRPTRAAGAISVAAAFEVHSGYGSSAEYLSLSMARAGSAVHAIPLGLLPEGLSNELMGMVNRKPASPDQPTIYHSWIRRDIEPFRDGRELFISTMWEANRFPAAWVPTLQEARAVIVPSTFVAESCRASGVTRPVVVVPLGIDPDIYCYQPRPQREGLVTLIVAPVDERKHTHLAIEAWKTAFAGDPAARLVIKTTYGYHNYVPDDPRITYVDRVETTRGIVDYYRAADILLALGSEGFGMPLVEGLATGLAVVALDAEGQSDACRDAGERVFAVPAAGRELHDSHILGPAGYRSTPHFDTVVRHLRWIDGHRDEARQIGRDASSWAVVNRNIWSFGAGVLDVIGRTSARTRRTVPARTLWVTTLGTPCGIADTTARLQRNLPSVRLTATEPPGSATGVVHVEYEPSILDERQLERFAAQARERGVAVVVTEHSVFDRPAGWERTVRALVSHTSAGAELLRRRNPNTRVEVIPLGCETWSFPRKQTRGQTIGCFGFPGPHKGLSRLAAAARLVPGAEIILFAAHSGPTPTDLVDWPSDVTLHWERTWLPLGAIAARLAAESDVIALPYDEVAHRSASSAALVALSTGVPVLTSDTTWFADLGSAVVRVGDGADRMADGLRHLFNDDRLRQETVTAAREYCHANSWSRVAARHVDLWNSFESV